MLQLLRTFLLAGIVLAGCSDFKGFGGTFADASGYWRYWVQVEEDPPVDETGPHSVFFAQTDGALDGPDASGNVSSNQITWRTPVSGAATTTTFTGTISGDMVTGTFARTGGSSETGTWRATRFVPMGTLTSSGAVGGLAVDVNTTSAIGDRRYADKALSVLVAVVAIHLEGGQRLELSFSPTNLAVGSLVVPDDVSVTARLVTDTDSREVPATAGTVDVTKYDGTGLTATYSLDLVGGDTLAGSIDVAFDLESFGS